MSTFAAAILDELMGRDRNSNPDEKKKELNWSDHETCKYYLCGFCPALLFQNTRADIGICNKIHEDELAKSYQGSSRYMKMGYEEDFMLYLQQIIADIDRKINRNVSRLSYNASHAKEQAQKAQEDRINKLTEKINTLVEKVEELGNMGEVDEAQSTMKIVDTLKSERTQQELAMSSIQPIIMIKEMEVCTVCGAFLVVGDAPQRIEEHLAGKLHMGYAKVRASIPTIKDKLMAAEAERERKRQERRINDTEGSTRDENNKLRTDGDTREVRRMRGRSKERSEDRSKDRSNSRKRSRSINNRDPPRSRVDDHRNTNGHVYPNKQDADRRDRDADRKDRDADRRGRDDDGRYRDDDKKSRDDKRRDRDDIKNDRERMKRGDEKSGRDEQDRKERSREGDREKGKERDRKRSRHGDRSRSKSHKRDDRHSNKR